MAKFHRKLIMVNEMEDDSDPQNKFSVVLKTLNYYLNYLNFICTLEVTNFGKCSSCLVEILLSS